MRALLRILRVVAVLLVVVIGGFFILKAFGLRVEMAGTGMTPLFTFHDPDEHYEAIEEERAAERLETAVQPTVPPEEAVSSEVATEEAASAAPSAPWPYYRGPRRDGSYDQTPIRTDWPDGGLPEVWRTKVGGGYASMIVAEGKVFTIEQRRDEEVVAAYTLDSGRQVWERGWKGFFSETLGGDGPRATPAYDSGKIYALGAEGELQCLQASDGKPLWRTNILTDAGSRNITWGMSGAPLVVDDLVVVNPGGSGKAVAAYNKLSGEIVWQTQSGGAGYASPDVATLVGRRQILLMSGEKIMGLRIADGSLLWEFPWRTNQNINSAQPIVVDDSHVLISSAYGHGAALLELSAAGDGIAVKELWQKNTLKNKFNSSVLYEGAVYGLDESILASVDVWTGDRNWKGGRYGFGQLLLADGHLIVLTEKGEIVLVKATPESHQEIASFQALEGKTWNTPAMADGLLLVRNQTEMAAYRIAP